MAWGRINKSTAHTDCPLDHIVNLRCRICRERQKVAKAMQWYSLSFPWMQWMVTAGKGDRFMYRFGPSTMKTLVPPRREEHHHEINRGRNSILSLPRQRAYIAWTKVETICTIGDGSVQSSEEDWAKKQVVFLLFTSVIPCLPTRVGFTKAKWVFIEKDKRLSTQLPGSGKYPLLHAKPCTTFLIRCDSLGFKHVRNSRLDEKGLGRDQ